MLYHVIYFSKAIGIMEKEDLHLLLKQSREWNAGHQLTGMLVYIRGNALSKDSGRFMQVLEGPQEEVEYMFNLIKQDARHHRVTLIKHEPLQKRNFPDWQMGFKSVDIADNHQVIDGYFELNDEFLGSAVFTKSNLALNFLRSFYTMVKTLNQ
jgi:hypothetical protein